MARPSTCGAVCRMAAWRGVPRPVRPGDAIALYLTGLGRKAADFRGGRRPQDYLGSRESIQIVVQGLAARSCTPGCSRSTRGWIRSRCKLPAYTLPAGKKTVTIQISAPSTGQDRELTRSSRIRSLTV